MKTNRTRNQRKRIIEEIFSYLAMGVVFFAVCLILCGCFCKVWATHPAEQPITYEQHISRYQNGGEGK